jgi:hypothetical protein
MVSNFAGVCTLLREQNYKIAQGKGDDVAVADYAVLVNRLVKLLAHRTAPHPQTNPKP